MLERPEYSPAESCLLVFSLARRIRLVIDQTSLCAQPVRTSPPPEQASDRRLVQRCWYQFIVSDRAMWLGAQLFLKAARAYPMSTPWYAGLKERVNVLSMTSH